MFELAPPLQKMPSEQALQAEARLWPVAAEKNPGAQLTLARPAPGQNCPAGQVTVSDVAPPPQRMPGLQGKQLVRPGVAAK